MSGPDRSEQVAIREAAFRIANERMFGWNDPAPPQAAEPYLCECALEECRERVRLTRPEYEAVRADPRHFAVRHGHVLPELEAEIATLEGYTVIEKPSALLPLLRETNPREPAEGPARDEATRLADEIAAQED